MRIVSFRLHVIDAIVVAQSVASFFSAPILPLIEFNKWNVEIQRFIHTWLKIENRNTVVVIVIYFIFYSFLCMLSTTSPMQFENKDFGRLLLFLWCDLFIDAIELPLKFKIVSIIPKAIKSVLKIFCCALKINNFFSVSSCRESLCLRPILNFYSWNKLHFCLFAMKNGFFFNIS